VPTDKPRLYVSAIALPILLFCSLLLGSIPAENLILLVVLRGSSIILMGMNVEILRKILKEKSIDRTSGPANGYNIYFWISAVFVCGGLYFIVRLVRNQPIIDGTFSNILVGVSILIVGIIFFLIFGSTQKKTKS